MDDEPDTLRLQMLNFEVAMGPFTVSAPYRIQHTHYITRYLVITLVVLLRQGKMYRVRNDGGCLQKIYTDF